MPPMAARYQLQDQAQFVHVFVVLLPCILILVFSNCFRNVPNLWVDVWSHTSRADIERPLLDNVKISLSLALSSVHHSVVTHRMDHNPTL